jgi:hypothetical protein
VRLATRLFIASGLIILATVVGLVSAADGYLRRGLEVETADELEREARLVAALLVTDSSAWPEEARRLGALIGRRVTLVDEAGRVAAPSSTGRPCRGSRTTGRVPRSSPPRATAWATTGA